MRNLFYVLCAVVLGILLFTVLGCSGDDGVYTPIADAGPVEDAGPGPDAPDAGPDPIIYEDLFILSTSPLDGAVDVALNVSPVRVTFSAEMNTATLNSETFYVTTGDPAVLVEGSVETNNTNTAALFIPDVNFEEDTLVTATVTTEARNLEGTCLLEDYVWSFTTIGIVDVCVSLGELPVDLGTAGDFSILAKSGISTIPQSDITGDIGVSPIDSTAITGFSSTLDSSTTFATSTQVTGKMYAADYTPPTPSKMTTAVSDMETAFTTAAGRAAGVTELGAGNISGMTLEPNVYKWGTGLLITTDVTLTGCPTDVWIFQVAQDFTMESGAKILLAGGAQAKNIFWQVSGFVDLGTTTHLEGNILSQNQIVLKTGASVNGRLLAQKAVTLDRSTVIQPSN